MLHLHQKLGHVNLHCLQKLIRNSVFGSRFKLLGNCDPPLCKACIHGKQHRRAIIDPTPLDISHLEPGDCVSGDQVESSTPGLIPAYHGSPTTQSYHAGTLFVDHSSCFLHFTPHQSTGSSEAISAKHSFELQASYYNHQIKCYHTDNGIFYV